MAKKISHKQQISFLCAKILQKFPQAAPATVETFTEAFLKDKGGEELLNYINEDFSLHLCRSWSLLQKKPPCSAYGDARVELFSHTVTREPSVLNRTIVLIAQDDMPFIVDSLLALFEGCGRKVHSFIEKDIAVTRSADGNLLNVGSGRPETFIYFELKGKTSPEDLDVLRAQILDVLDDVRLAVQDWRKMREITRAVAKQLKETNSTESAAEAVQLLHWMDDHHFTFLGYNSYSPTGKNEGSLGISRKDKWKDVFDPTALKKHFEELYASQTFLSFFQTKEISPVHRPHPMGIVEIKIVDPATNVATIHHFIGLSSAVSYNQSPREIPFIRKKIQHLLTKSGLTSHGYSGKLLVQIVEHFPRDELFLASDDGLFDIASAIMRLGHHQSVALYCREDPFQEFRSVLIYIQKERYAPELLKTFSQILEKRIGSPVTRAQVNVGDIHFVRFDILFVGNTSKPIDLTQIHQELEASSLTWSETLQNVLIDRLGDDVGQSLGAQYSTAFPENYQHRFSVEEAVTDIHKMEELTPASLNTLIYGINNEESRAPFKIKIFTETGELPLSTLFPILSHMGIDVFKTTAYQIKLPGKKSFWIQELEPMTGTPLSHPETIHTRFHTLFSAALSGQVENDGFHSLLLNTPLEGRHICILRALAKYLKQIRFPISQQLMEETFAAYPKIAETLIQLFEARLSPDNISIDQSAREADIRQHLESEMEQIASQDQDRVVRGFVNLIMSIVRTNFFAVSREAEIPSHISFKFDCALIDDLPLPRPKFEIFIYSTRMEAVHLRSGKVARGGIRWSDRRDDFRTEILGLLKAQNIKNVVIVPTGSKGGFVLKNPPQDSLALRQEAVACYQIMMRGLLEITDNIEDSKKVIHPHDIVCLDGEDPYLVVAADKGTASFSDIANEISTTAGFWLGDAFASGGSNGYDHKKIGITARGAWESTRRHFLQIGMNPDHDEFTVIGVGDMSGDVFGNGMLLSDKIKLIGAFNHIHIFVDPNPNPASSFLERDRLFKKPGSTWMDYAPALISTGGGVFSRSDKHILISPEMKACFDIPEETTRLSPQQLIQYMLKASVDLLWFGGIGTFIKSTSEAHADAHDRNNDLVRVNGQDLRCRVVVEGANLGVTQLGRIEASLCGRLINTDALDNSAGVDCSDHEVNIKILLEQVVKAKKLTPSQRDGLLADMTESVASLVLKDNYLQNLRVCIKRHMGIQQIETEALLIKRMEEEGILNRQESSLPNESILAERISQNIGLSGPELSVLVAYAKIWLDRHITTSDSLLFDPLLEQDLIEYFPEKLIGPYKAEILTHALRKEILTMLLANEVINRFGACFIYRLETFSGKSIPEIVRVIRMLISIFNIRPLWKQLEALDGKVSPDVQTQSFLLLNFALEKASLWLLQNDTPDLPMSDVVAKFSTSIQELLKTIEKEGLSESEDYPPFLQELPAQFSCTLSTLLTIGEVAFSLVSIAEETKANVSEAASVYFAIGNYLGISWAKKMLDQIQTTSNWEKMSQSFLSGDLARHQSTLSTLFLNSRQKWASLEAWLAHHETVFASNINIVNQCRETGGPLTVAHINVIERSLSAMLRRINAS